MNLGNALGFFGFGILLWALPTVAPGWFPHTAIDGSSTRALWSQGMGFVQALIGLCYMLKQACALAPAMRRAVVRGAVATSDWEGDALPEPVLAVSRAALGGASPDVAPDLVPVATANASEAAHWRWLWPSLGKQPWLDSGVRTMISGETAAGRRALAAALFRHHPRHSLVHLTHVDVIDLDALQRTPGWRAMLERWMGQQAGGLTG